MVGGIIGGGLATQEKLFGGAFSRAKERMWERAKSLGADGVVGMQINFTSPGDLNSMILVVTGTAVRFEKNNQVINASSSEEEYEGW